MTVSPTASWALSQNLYVSQHTMTGTWYACATIATCGLQGKQRCLSRGGSGSHGKAPSWPRRQWSTQRKGSVVNHRRPGPAEHRPVIHHGLLNRVDQCDAIENGYSTRARKGAHRRPDEDLANVRHDVRKRIQLDVGARHPESDHRGQQRLALHARPRVHHLLPSRVGQQVAIEIATEAVYPPGSRAHHQRDGLALVGLRGGVAAGGVRAAATRGRAASARVGSCCGLCRPVRGCWRAVEGWQLTCAALRTSSTTSE